MKLLQKFDSTFFETVNKRKVRIGGQLGIWGQRGQLPLCSVKKLMIVTAEEQNLL